MKLRSEECIEALIKYREEKCIDRIDNACVDLLLNNDPFNSVEIVNNLLSNYPEDIHNLILEQLTLREGNIIRELNIEGQTLEIADDNSDYKLKENKVQSKEYINFVDSTLIDHTNTIIDVIDIVVDEYIRTCDDKSLEGFCYIIEGLIISLNSSFLDNFKDKLEEFEDKPTIESKMKERGLRIIK